MILSCVLASVLVTSAFAYPHVTRWPRGTPAPSTPLTTKIYLWELIWGAKVEEGEYTTMMFQYYNDQLEHGNYPKHKYDRCYKDYMRCTLSYTLPQTVCGFKWWKSPSLLESYKTMYRGVLKPVTYCEVYFENCLIGHRAWRVLNYGWCYYPAYYTFQIHPLERYTSKEKSWYRPPKIVDYFYIDEFAYNTPCILILVGGGVWPRANRRALLRLSTKAMRPILAKKNDGYLSKFFSLFNLSSSWQRFRRQNLKDLFRTTTTVRENYREPYWTNGHWVFDRYNYTTTTEFSNTTTTTTTTEASSTKCKKVQKIVLVTEEITKTTDIYDFLKYSTNSTHKQCNVICLRIYLRYGKICAMRLKTETWKSDSYVYLYKTFNNICELERENCLHAKQWRLRHSGPCYIGVPPWWAWDYENFHRFTHFPTVHSSLQSRAASFGNLNFSFVDTQLPWLGRVGQLQAKGFYYFWYCFLGRNWLMC